MNKLIDIDTVEDLRNHFPDFLDGTEKGRIHLPVPVIDISQWRGGLTDPYALALGIDPVQMEKVIYYAAYVISDPLQSGMKKHDIITCVELDNYKRDLFEQNPADLENKIPQVVSGAAGIKLLLDSFDFTAAMKKTRLDERKLMQDYETLWDSRDEDDPDFSDEDETTLGRLNVGLANVRTKIDAINYVAAHRSTFIVSTLRIFPTSLLHIIKDMARENLYVERYLENAYCKILNRIRRIYRLTELQAPDIILLNEKRMLQEAVDQLIANGRRGRPVCESYRLPGTPQDEETTDENTVSSLPYPSLMDIVARYTSFI